VKRRAVYRIFGLFAVAGDRKVGAARYT